MSRPVVLLVLAVSTLAGQERLSWTESVREALQRHPRLQVAAERIRAHQALVQQAGLPRNPRLITQVENLRAASGNTPFSYPRDTDNFLFLSKTFEAGQKRQRRVELAEADVVRSELERQVEVLALAREVTDAYWTALAAQRDAGLLAETVRTLDGTVAYHETRVREGAAAEVDLLRVRLERERVVSELLAAERTRERARINLLRTLGRAEFPNVVLTEPLDGLHSSDVPTEASALERRPETRALRQGIQQAEANARLQEARAVPDPEVVFGYKRTAGINATIGGVQLDLPWQNRNQGQIAAAQAEVRVAQSALRAGEGFVRAELAAAVRDYTLRQTQLRDQIGPMRERADEIARIVDAAYREGGLDLLRLLDAQRARLETQRLALRLLAEYQQSYRTLLLVAGELP